jgi:two-component system, cell cycle sensor histidine kinase and response regulator CckA
MAMMEGRMKVVQSRQRELSTTSVSGEYKSTTNGDLFYVDQKLSDIFEYGSPEEMISTSVFSWCKNATDGQRIKEMLGTTGTIDNLEIESVTRNGKMRNLLLSASLSMGVIQGTIKDITEIRQLDFRLLQSQKLESLGMLAGGIAHDFNNILGIIQGHLMMLERYHEDPDRYARSLKAIQNATERGATLASQILTFARERSIAWADVQVNNVVTELAKLLIETFPRSINISTFLQGSQPLIAGDVNLVHQMLFNLCINARDAMPKGGELSIATAIVDGTKFFNDFPKATTGKYVSIEVRDTGTGIDEATLQRMFEPFFTTKSPDKGTGLGLSIVQSIVDGHHGFLDVKSKPGAGTTFTVYLPVRERVEAAPVVEEAVGPIAGAGETILLIEDEERIRELMVTILEGNGYCVLSAGDGEEGLRLFLDHHSEIALIISDLGLPKLAGADMLERIKAFDPAVRIILASGFVDAEVKVRLQHMGIQHIIGKPYMPDAVLQKVREVLDGTG